MTEKTFTTYEIARFCDVYPSSVIHWINDGKLVAYNTPGGHHRITRANLLTFLNEFKIPIPPELSPRGVLIVDDEPEMCRVIERAFSRHSDIFQTEIFHAGIDALIRIGQAPPALVLLDVVMPDMNGVEVCRILKSRPETRGIKIIGMSGKMTHAKEKLSDYQVDAFFSKPLDMTAVLTKAAELLGAALPASIVNERRA